MVIAKVDAYLESLVTEALRPARVAVNFDPDLPPKGDRGRGNATVSVLLFDIREEVDRRPADWQDVRDRETYSGRRPPTRFYRLRYLVTAWGSDTRAEHELLGSIVEKLPVSPFPVDEEETTIEVALPTDGGLQTLLDLWSAFGVAPRAAIELHAIARVEAALEAVGPPVEHLRLRVEQTGTGARTPVFSDSAIVRKWRSTRVDEHTADDETATGSGTRRDAHGSNAEHNSRTRKR
jgi:hypothetical protein